MNQLLKCPKCNDDRDKRVREWKDSIRAYVEAPAMQTLLSRFGYFAPNGSLEEKLFSLRSFVDDRWDYRVKAGGGERWTVSDKDPIVIEHREEIVRCAYDLGMIDQKNLEVSCDYIMPLGGARRANMDRMVEARRVLMESPDKSASIVALTTERPLGDIEIPYVEEYVDDPVAGVTTEFDVVCGAMEKVFDVHDSCDEGHFDINKRSLSWRIRRYGDLAVVSAPSKKPDKRRANTKDTLEFFVDAFEVSKGSVLHFTTSSIYINYQMASLMPIAIERNLEMRFSGSGEKGADQQRVVSNYLQEIKGSIDAICDGLGLI